MRARIVGIIALVALAAVLVPVSAAAASRDDDEDAHIEGVIVSLPASGLVGDWMVGNTVVHVTASTEIEQEHGPAVVGATVEVEGTAEADGHITAHKVEVKEGAEDDDFGQIEFEGVVQVLPATTGLIGDWVVSGLTVHVTTATELNPEEGPFAVGAMVKVEGLLEANGSVTAHEIKTENEGDFDDDSGSLTGVVQRLPSNSNLTGNWRVSTQTVHVRRGTRIVRHGHDIARGATVLVAGSWLRDGSIRAAKVVVRG